MTNRLADASSPYLRQHAHNPVDWWPWCEEALTEARERDVPILLSVGYAACHWCHVMAHEVFEDAEVGAALREGFVAIKVDREERPDLDSVYMSATVALTGRGGWPMTCLLTPDGRPFFAATYIPRPQFLHLLASASEAWTERRAEVEDSADRIAEALRAQVEAQANLAPVLDDGTGAVDRTVGGVVTGVEGPGATPGSVLDAALDAAEERAASTFDWARGGFGTSPKFPPSMVLSWLLRHHDRTGTPRALQMVESTCEAMARGGLYDQLAGGFARYSTDADWIVPHFEKMLYHNALLLSVYADWYRVSGSPLAERVTRETAEFLLRDLRTTEGAFASALDADTPVTPVTQATPVTPDAAATPATPATPDTAGAVGGDGADRSHGGSSSIGVEGATYVWTPAQLVEVLGEEDGASAALLLEVTELGTFERGTSVLQRRVDADPAWWRSVRDRLWRARDARPQPSRDDKIVTAWNGLAIAALADAGTALGEQRFIDAAATCAEFVVGTHLVDGRCRRTSRAGVVGEALGVAEDHGNLAHGLVRLHAATGRPVWLEVAGALLDVAVDLFDASDGGFHDTGNDAERLLLRPRSDTDDAEPCGLSSLSRALLEYGAYAGSTAHLDRARIALDVGCRVALRTPTFGGWTLAAAELVAAGPLTVAIASPPGEEADVTGLVSASARHPRAFVLVGAPDSAPLLTDRPARHGVPTAYVCRGTVCDAPLTRVEQLEEAIATPAP